MMASSTVLPQDNLRSYILSALQRIYRDLETVSIVQLIETLLNMSYIDYNM